MAGIETKRFVGLQQSVAKHLECGICLNVYLKPVDTKCKHTFCCHCIATHIQMPTNGTLCPQCSQPLTTRKRSKSSGNVVVINGNVILEKNRKIDDIINDLKIRCDYYSKGCEEVLEFGLLSAHLKWCPFRTTRNRHMCSDCGSLEGMDNPHNCVQVLKQTINELEKQNNELKKKIKK